MVNVSNLTTIPNVGEATARDLNRIGIFKVSDLKAADEVGLFETLCEIDGVKHDPCTLDVFMSAVDYVTNGTSKP
ncbi:MAG: mitomycin resistance protein [Candidatus Saccharimonas sp.]|nr:mitomycin resistance protein [Candidatus Saccharimonas sp.]